jgi:hypothetical protein
MMPLVAGGHSMLCPYNSDGMSLLLEKAGMTLGTLSE